MRLGLGLVLGCRQSALGLEQGKGAGTAMKRGRGSRKTCSPHFCLKHAFLLLLPLLWQKELVPGPSSTGE